MCKLYRMTKNKAEVAVHSRMPAVLARDDYALWTAGAPDEARALCTA